MDNLQQKILGDNKIMLGIVIGQEAIYVPAINFINLSINYQSSLLITLYLILFLLQ